MLLGEPIFSSQFNFFVPHCLSAPKSLITSDQVGVAGTRAAPNWRIWLRDGGTIEILNAAKWQ